MKKIDFHVHISDPIPLAETAENFRELCARKGYTGICMQAYTHDVSELHLTCNEDALALKKMLKGSYAFAALHQDDKDFVAQAKRYMATGFDGIKILEGKPSEYRYLGYGLNHPSFTAFFDYAEEMQIPILLHNNDPAKNWDITQVSPRAIERGWYYDEKMPSHEWFFRTFEDVMATHPNLRVALAHFGFYADDLDRAERLMESYPNLYMDLTPALDILWTLSENAPRAEAFFRKYHDRILYGTDAQNDLTGFAREYNDAKTDTIDTFLMGTESRVIREHLICPISLTDEMLENIYYNTAMRFIKK